MVDVEAVCRRAREANEDGLGALEEETAKAEPVVAAAREAWLDDAAIGRILREAESKGYGSGWEALTQATAERLQRKSAAETVARQIGLGIEYCYANAGHGVDPVAHLERVTALWGRARGAGLNNEHLNDLYRGAEHREAGTGWTAIEDATAEREQREAEAVAAARSVFVDIDAMKWRAREQEEDELDALEEETAKATPVVAAARAAGLGDAAVGRILREAESKESGSGWVALAQATQDRTGRRATAEETAREWLVDIGAVYGRAREGDEDELVALEEETAKAEPVVAAARAAGLDDAAIGRIRDEAESNEPGSGLEAVSTATQEWARERELRAEEERERAALADLTAEVRATSAGAERLEEGRRARFDTTKRPLTLDDEMIVVKEVKGRIGADLARRAATVEDSPGGRELRRRVERRRGGPPQRLPELEETIEAVELRVKAADNAQERLMAPARDPERRDRRVPFVNTAVLDAVPADGDEPFVEDVLWLLQARLAHGEQKGVDRGGYDADDREKSAQRHFGSALASAFEWCVLRIRALILAACHRVLGGRGEMGGRVQASLEEAEAARQSWQRRAHEEALTVGIDPDALSVEARTDGRDEGAAVMEETARRRQVISDAMANHIDVDAVRAANAREPGSWFPAVEAALERFRTAAEAAPWLDLDAKAFCASARSRGEDPVGALEEETASRARVRLLADFVGLSFREGRGIYRAAEKERRGSGYTAVANECIRRQARERVRNELPFSYSQPFSPRTWALAVVDEAATDLLREVQDDDFLHSRLSEVLASAPGSAEERQGAERCYYRPEIKAELQRLEAERGWLSSTPTEEDALKVVRERFIPELADRVRAACDSVADLDRLVARFVEDDWVRRVVTELPQDLPREPLYPGSSSGPTAASDERLSRNAAATGDPRVRKVLVAYQAHNAYGAGDRQRAETALLDRRRRKEEESGKTREQAADAASRAHDAELLRIVQDVCRRVQFREFEELCRERVRDRIATSTDPGLAHNYGAQKRDPGVHPQGWSW